MPKQKKKLQSKYNWRYIYYYYRKAVLAGIFGLVILILSVAVIYPQTQSTLEAWQDWEKNRKLASTLGQKTNQLELLPQTEVFAQADNINRSLPSRKPLVELLTSLNAVAGQSGVSLSEFSLAPGLIASDSATFSEAAAKTSSKKIDYDSMEIAMKVTGNLQEINSFITGLENMAPFSTLTNLRLSEYVAEANQRTRVTDDFEAELEVTSFFFTKPITASLRSTLPNLGKAEYTEVLAEISEYYYPNVDAPPFIQNGGLEDLFGVEALQIGLPEPEPEPVQLDLN